MASRFEEERLQVDKIALADTRPVLVFGMPLFWLMVTMFVPAIVVVITIVAGHPNPWFLIVSVPMALAGRAIVARDLNRPRILLLWLITGSAFAHRKSGQGETLPVLPSKPDPWAGYTHD
ncbi:VirB3 family type IV secretion system protein [Gluconobacter cerinus]|uniref:VirB3 family type IV secretion system protein n=1 Tax=Gluconobacter cerinus TaxID=38307 RepID=UPI001B8BC420|nr:VirB3 family type IV secretion system protein [Gluconobacter cerinus]MBS0984274.1 VirB3 family type IV secretion system protein [Gluconobacter cerinus]